MSCKKDEEYILLDMRVYGQTLNRKNNIALFFITDTGLSAAGGYPLTKLLVAARVEK